MSVFQQFVERKFGENSCFLCGATLNEANRTDEHVVPRWLQTRFNLWDERLILLNGTSIPYRQLTIPCCYDCNNQFLSPVERQMAAAVEQGYLAVEQVDRITKFIWLGKLFYGLLYKELLLPLDRRSPHEGSIVEPDLLQRFQAHHFFLQAARLPMEFVDFFPASIFVFDLQVPDDHRFQFDVRDSLGGMCVAVQMGTVGLIAVLQDCGTQRELRADLIAKLLPVTLHPLQFRELTALCWYTASLFDRVPKFMSVETDGIIQHILNPLQGFTNKPIYRDWEQSEYAEYLAFHTGVDVNELFRPPDQVISWLTDDDGNPKTLTLESVPWP